MLEKKKQEGKKKRKKPIAQLVGALASLICAIIMAILIYHDALIRYFSDIRQVMTHSCIGIIIIGIVLLLYALILTIDIMYFRLGGTRNESDRIFAKMKRIAWIGGIFFIGGIIGLTTFHVNEIIAIILQDIELYTLAFVIEVLLLTVILTVLALFNYFKKSGG